MYLSSAQNQGAVRCSAPQTAFSAVAAPRVPSMRNYYNIAGGCFLGSSRVFKIDNLGTVRTEEVQNLKKGCQVLSNYGKTTIQTIIELKYEGPIYKVGGCMMLTAYHPVLIDNIPSFPCELSPLPVYEKYLGFVYDIVLEDRGILRSPFNIGDQIGSDIVMFVATMGHNVHLPKFSHHYFGSERVVDDLKKHKNWQDGHIQILNPKFERNDNQEVIRIIF
jgi:hypothetical protein